MNIATNDVTVVNTETSDPIPGPAPFGVSDLLRVARTRWRIILGVAAAIFLVTVIITYLLPPYYTATSMVMLDSRKNNVVSADAVLADLTGDPATFQNQVQILESRILAGRIADKEHLDRNPEYNPAIAPPTVLSTIRSIAKQLNPMSWFAPASPEIDPKEALRNSIIDQLLQNLNASVIGLSSSFSIQYQDKDSALAARIANDYADGYVDDQLTTKLEATQKANKWLADRLVDLSKQTHAADAAVADYKMRNNITENYQGESVVDQQVRDLNSQLVLARSQLAEQEARYTRMISLVKAGRSADVSQVVQSPLISQLRQQETDLMRQEADLSAKYGPNHPKLMDLRSQKANLETKITEEVNRVVQTVDSDVAVARAHVSSMQASLAGLERQSGDQNKASVQLKALESSATSTRAQYDSFLTRFQQVQDQTGIQTADARILSRAGQPIQPTFPNKKLILPASLVLSLFCGFALALSREFLNRGLRSVRQAEAFLRLPVLSTIPELAASAGRKVNPSDWVADKPLSAFAEAIRSIQISLPAAKSGRANILLVTSALPGEGKTTIAVSLARLAAGAGQKTIIVDADLRHPNVAKAMNIRPNEKGIAELLLGSAPPASCVQQDPKSKSYFIGAAQRVANAPELMVAATMEKLLDTLRDNFDLVIIDSAPVLPVNDARVLAKLADAVILVVRWEKTPRDAAAAAARNLLDVGAPLAGLVMSRMDPDQEQYYSAGYPGYRAYANYYEN